MCWGAMGDAAATSLAAEAAGPAAVALDWEVVVAAAAVATAAAVDWPVGWAVAVVVALVAAVKEWAAVEAAMEVEVGG